MCTLHASSAVAEEHAPPAAPPPNGATPPSSAATPPAGSPLRLEDAVRIALSNNERARKAPLRLEVANGQLDKARTAFYPSLTAQGSGQLSSASAASKGGRALTESTTLSLNQPLLNPSAFPQYWQAEHTRESEKWGAAQDKRQLAFDTAKQFLQTLATERVLEAAVRRLEKAKTNVENTQARADAQLASTNDVTKARIDLATSESSVSQAQGNLERARIQLEFLMGAPVPPELAAPDRTTHAAQAFDNPRANAVTAAIDRRPDIRSSHERTEALRESAKEPYYRMAPTLSVAGQIRANPDPQPTERGIDETLTLNLTWNIFDNGGRYADRRTRVAQLESQALDEASLKRSVGTDVRIALAALRAAREGYRIADEQVASAQRNVDEVEILYRQGLSTAFEVTDANSKRFDAEVTRESAKLTMEQGYLDLLNALGYGPVEDDGGGR